MAESERWNDSILVAAIAILYGTTQGMAVQLDGLRTQVDPHWRRGISYLKIGLRWLNGVVNKGRQLLRSEAESGCQWEWSERDQL